MSRSQLFLVMGIGVFVVFILALHAVVSGTDGMIPLISFVLAILLLIALGFLMSVLLKRGKVRLPFVAPVPPPPLLLASPTTPSRSVKQEYIEPRRQRGASGPTSAFSPETGEPLLVLSESCRLPKHTLYTNTLVLEDVYGQSHRRSAADVLLEEIRNKVKEVALVVITTQTRYVEPYPWSYLAGSEQGRAFQPPSLQSLYAVVKDHHVADFCKAVIAHGDHVVLDLASYPDRSEAAVILRTFLFNLYRFSLLTARKCLVMVMDAEAILPDEETMEARFFPSQQDSLEVSYDFLRLISDGAAAGIYPILVARNLHKLSRFALASTRLVMTNKSLLADEIEPFLTLTHLSLDDLNGLYNHGHVLFSDTQRLYRDPTARSKRPEILEFPLRASSYFHYPRSYGRGLQEPATSPTVEESVAYSPPLTESEKRAILEFATYLVQEKPQLVLLETFIHPPAPLDQELVRLGLLQRYQQQGFLVRERDARGLLKRTEALLLQHTESRVVQGQETEVQKKSHLEVIENTRHLGNAKHSENVAEEQQQVQMKSASLRSTAIQEPMHSTWQLPPLSLLLIPEIVNMSEMTRHVSEQAGIIRETLRSFRVDAEVRNEDISIGPTIVRFGIRPTGKPERKHDEKTGQLVPVHDATGKIVYETRTRVSTIMKLENDLALILEAKAIRMRAPVSERPYVGVEIPNKNSRLVTLREVLESKEYQHAKTISKLVVALGRDVAGMIRFGDLARMPHLLIAGSTGSGKSVMINAIIASIITQATPDDVRLLMVDPKMVELNMYNGIPHLLSPVVTEVKLVVSLLKNSLSEMERRYHIFSQLGVRNLDSYRKMRAERMAKGDNSLVNLPAIVIIIDELADLMMAAPEEVEGMICRLAQLARATGIHLVVATQRPSVDVITGLIKANIPTRISFMVSSAVDSRTIIDMGGAERLLGRGDMLYLPSDAGQPERMQGSFLADEEVERLVRYWREQATQHTSTVANGGIEIEPTVIQGHVEPGWELKEQDSEDDELDDELLDKAEEVVREYEKASISLLQRRLKIGYSRAARLIDQLEERGVVKSLQMKKAPVPPSFVTGNGAENNVESEAYKNDDDENVLPNSSLRGQSASLSEVEDDDSDEDGADQEGEEDVSPVEWSRTHLISTFGKNLAPLLENIAQGNEVEVMGGNFSFEELELLVAARVFFREEISAEYVRRYFHLSNRATPLIEKLENLGILRPYAGGSRPRRITDDRGGDTLPTTLKEVRNLVDWHIEREQAHEEVGVVSS